MRPGALQEQAKGISINKARYLRLCVLGLHARVFTQVCACVYTGGVLHP